MSFVKPLSKTLMSCGLALAVFGGCGKTDANAAPSEKPAEPLPGPSAKGDSWNAEAKVTHDQKKNVWTLDVVMTAAEGYHVNLEYPYRFAQPLKEEDRTVVFDTTSWPKEKKDWSKDDANFVLENCKDTDKGKECKQLHFTVTFKPKDGVAVEKANAAGTLKFGVCSPDKCKMDKAPLAVALTKAKNV